MVRWDERGGVFLAGSMAVALALASCGGRASSSQPNGSANESGAASYLQGGAIGIGGGASRGGAGSSNGGSAAAGDGATSGTTTLPESDAGPPVCNDSCPEVDCPSDQMLQFQNMLCCPVCESCSASDHAACSPSYDCGPAAHAEIPPGSCCVTCVAKDQSTCATQMESANDGTFAAYPKYNQQCQVDSDCAGAVLSTTCSQSCFYALKSLLPAYLAELTKVRQCPACALPPPSAPTCVAPVCLNQTCTLPDFK